MRQLNISEAERLIKKHGIKFAKSVTVHSLDGALKASGQMGYPVVMKPISDDILHKTEVKAVELNLDDRTSVESAYERLNKNLKRHCPKAKIKGFQIQKMVPDGYEIIVGGKRDPQFGPVVIFGMGGIFVEIINDISMRICPLSRKDAGEMVKETKGYKILCGARGHKPANIRAIEDAILKVSEIMMKDKSVMELDLNPMFASDEVVAVDARIIKNG